MTPNKRTLPTPSNSQQSSNAVCFDAVNDNVFGHRILLYGGGGIGKTTLSCLAPGDVAFVDADESLEKLKPALTEDEITIPVKVRCSDWSTLMMATRAGGYDGKKTIVYDTGGVLEQWCIAAMLIEQDCAKIEDVGGGYGKGYKYTYEKWLTFLAALDAHHIRQGRNVIILAHDCVKAVPNPKGADFIRWEPLFQDASKDGSASIRMKMKNWADHVLFMSYDASISFVDVADKKTGVHAKPARASGVGIRQLFTAEMPYFMAKSRTTSDTFTIARGASPWDSIIK